MEKVVFITGVSSGFGLAIAMELAESGHKVYGTSRRDGLSLPNVVVLKADVNVFGSITHAVDTIIQKEGRIDVLINNSGIGLGGAIEDFSEQEAEKELNTNFLGVFRTIKCVLPYMRKQQGGTIITIGSIAGLMGIPFQGFYSASKFALEGLMQSLRYEVSGFNIHVVMVNPGDFATGFTQNRQIVMNDVHLAYKSAFDKTIAVIEKDESTGLPAKILSQKVKQIVGLKKPKSRFVVASMEQKLAVLLQKILPSKWFHKILASHYKI